ncbi:integral membrane protein [Stemphylium lycopersici]|uniref:Integral membrane protein n=1 Tax=Stemphylium lycopersici TaxID=183478 RepID=A0A364MX95_STELY|nr:integral membrane protein [Stemphylium lycopersici]RAQ99253.1 integral membrane protein [Stemphylium lycopersici]RAR06062.1 integral membrane protein [Stemphylium lycopersici]
MDPKWAAESNLTRLLALTGVFHFLALTSVGLRLYVRIGLLQSLGRDDVVIVLAALAALGGWICFILQGYHGFGRHTKTISDEDMVEFTHIGFYGSVISAIGALGLLKISIAFFLLRLRNNNLWRWYSYCLWALIALVSVYTVGAWLTFFLRCFPMEAAWTRDGVCYDPKIFLAVALTNTALNIFTDVCFATLPVPIIWSLQTSRTTRINLIGVLSLGYM